MHALERGSFSRGCRSSVACCPPRPRRRPARWRARAGGESERANRVPAARRGAAGRRLAVRCAHRAGPGARWHRRAPHPRPGPRPPRVRRRTARLDRAAVSALCAGARCGGHHARAGPDRPGALGARFAVGGRGGSALRSLQRGARLARRGEVPGAPASAACGRGHAGDGDALPRAAGCRRSVAGCAAARARHRRRRDRGADPQAPRRGLRTTDSDRSESPPCSSGLRCTCRTSRSKR